MNEQLKNMKKYTLVFRYTLLLKRLTAEGEEPVLSLELYAEDNMKALLEGEKHVQDIIGKEGYELVDAGMLMSRKVKERDLLFVKDDEEYDFVLSIIDKS